MFHFSFLLTFSSFVYPVFFPNLPYMLLSLTSIYICHHLSSWCFLCFSIFHSNFHISLPSLISSPNISAISEIFLFFLPYFSSFLPPCSCYLSTYISLSEQRVRSQLNSGITIGSLYSPITNFIFTVCVHSSKWLVFAPFLLLLLLWILS